MTTSKLIVGNQNYSSWSMRPWLFVRHHKLDIGIEKLTLFTEETRDRLNEHFSNGKVPLLIDNGLEIWDTMAILEYLAEQYPQTQGWPEDVQARAVARAICAEMHSSFSALRNELPMNCRRYFPGYKLSEKGMRDVDRIQKIWNLCRTNYGQSGPWLFGDFSISDAMYAPVVMRFRSIDIELDEISQYYYDTMHQSESVEEWLAAGKMEEEFLQEDELDWPSEPVD